MSNVQSRKEDVWITNAYAMFCCFIKTYTTRAIKLYFQWSWLVVIPRSSDWWW